MIKHAEAKSAALLVMLGLALLIVGCAEAEPVPRSTVVVEDAGIAYVEAGNSETNLLSIHYRLRTNSSVAPPPIYVRIRFHDEELRALLKDHPAAYSPYEDGLEMPIDWQGKNVYQGGYNLAFASAPVDAAQLEAIIGTGRAVELLVIDIETGEPALREWIRRYERVQE